MVEQTASRYLAVVDEALPGFVEKLYLTGSVALGAYQPGASDIDTLIVTSRHATDDDLGILADLHAARAGRPHLDGVYLDRETLIRQPSEQQVVPFVVDGEFRTGRPCGELNPVLWLLLTRYGIPVRGPSVADLGLTVDYEALRRYNLGNLETYWAPGAEPLRTTDTVQPEAIAWCVLGPARLHFTLAHHDVVSKAGAAAYLGELFPEYADVAARRSAGGAASRSCSPPPTRTPSPTPSMPWSLTHTIAGDPPRAGNPRRLRAEPDPIGILDHPRRSNNRRNGRASL